MRATFTAASRNTKTGPIPTTMTERKSCWDGCPFMDNGCYAELAPTGWHWDKLSSGVTGLSWDELCSSVSALPIGQLWRHNVAGDLPGENDMIDWRLLLQLVRANRRKRGFTFSHKPVIGSGSTEKRNRRLIRAANRSGFTINLSGNSPAHADRLADLAIGPVVTVLPREYARRGRGAQWLETIAEWRDRTAHLPKATPAGRRIAPCPATYTDTTCKYCKACSLPDRTAIIGFPSHGQRWWEVDQAILVN